MPLFVLKKYLLMSLNKLIKEIYFISSLAVSSCSMVNADKAACTISLNGQWEMGHGRNYTETVIVPGIYTDPIRMESGILWYRKEIILPEGNWKYATLELKGARFSPEVYINGVSISKQNGGMAPTFHLLNHKDVKPGKSIIIEIALSSLNNISESDASNIPKADHWRSNISSYLWDDVVLKFHNEIKINRLIPFYDIENKVIKLKYELDTIDYQKIKPVSIEIEITDLSGKKIIKKEFVKKDLNGELEIYYGANMQLWTPLNPNLYNLINYIENEKKKGTGERDIAGKLKKSGWNSEQVTYALRKYAGKRTGMPEIISTEKIFKTRDKNNLQKK